MTASTMTFLLAGLLLLATVLSISLSHFYRTRKALKEIRFGATKFLEGDLSYRLRMEGPKEITSLAQTMNAMATELEEQVKRLKELENIRKEFVANVSHELKTPVTSIRGFAETLRDGALDDREKAKQYLDIIARQAGRLSAIIEDLLDLARIEHRTEHEESESPLLPCTIGDVLKSAVEISTTQAVEKKIQITLSCPESISVSLKPALFEQALINLIDNAIKYSNPEGSITISCLRQGEWCEISIKDFGRGIAPEHLPRIFERFYRVDKGRSRELGGTGLGLSIAKHIVTLHGGDLTVSSELEQGSTFTIRIPVLPIVIPTKVGRRAVPTRRHFIKR